jgi:DNA-binding winged helix-turn-helix (wHTH) protein
LDVGRRVLLRDGEIVALSPKLYETLLVLVQSNGLVVSKDDLMTRVWPDTPFRLQTPRFVVWRTPLLCSVTVLMD